MPDMRQFVSLEDDQTKTECQHMDCNEFCPRNALISLPLVKWARKPNLEAVWTSGFSL